MHLRNDEKGDYAMGKAIVTIFLILLGTLTSQAQRGSESREFKEKLTPESRYSYSVIVSCYAATTSLPSFVRCLERYDQPCRDRRWHSVDRDLGLDKDRFCDRGDREPLNNHGKDCDRYQRKNDWSKGENDRSKS